jgi:DNA-binding transcriptional ArsR family regulator
MRHIRPMIETFAALAEPNRFRIVELLRSGARPVNDISERLKLNQPQVSKHLRALRIAGLVDVQPHAQQRLYEINPEALRRLHTWVERYRQLWEARFDELEAVIAELKEKEQTHARSKKRK